MANVKNITDLPLAESAEGLNLIVNDGGFAKQIAASEVGAQADWNITDENSPAYIKNKPSIVQADWAETDENNLAFVKNKPNIAQSDWAENDESKVAFIKNKPFYDNRVYTNTPEVTVNGIVNDWGYVKAADALDFDIYQMEFMSRDGSDGKKWTEIPIEISNYNNSNVLMIQTKDESWQGYTLGLYIPTQEDADIYYGGNEDNPFTPGFYLMASWSGDAVNVSYSFKYIGSGELKQIDSIYIPNEGYNNISSGKYSHAEGENTIAHDHCAHAEGYNTNAYGAYSHAEGSGTSASRWAHAEGYGSKASQICSHAEGSDTEASSTGAHAEGSGTIASGYYSHAEGMSTNAHGYYTHSEGMHTKAMSQSQHVQGEYNIIDTEGDQYSRGKYAHIVGNGTSSARSNAHTLDWSGNAWYAGTVECTGIILTSPNGTKYQISIADDGTLSANAMPL